MDFVIIGWLPKILKHLIFFQPTECNKIDNKDFKIFHRSFYQKLDNNVSERDEFQKIFYNSE